MAAITEPVFVVLSSEEVTPDIASAVVVAAVPVAFPKAKLPVIVVEARAAEERAINPPLALRVEPTLRTPPMVEDAVTAREPVVVPLRCEKSRPVKRPVLLMEKSVELTPAEVVEDMAKSVVVAVVEAAKILKSAVGLGVEEPTERPLRKLPASNSEVEEAWSPSLNQIGVDVELARLPKLRSEVKGQA